MARTKTKDSAKSTATIGFEAELWLTADKLRRVLDTPRCESEWPGRGAQELAPHVR